MFGFGKRKAKMSKKQPEACQGECGTCGECVEKQNEPSPTIRLVTDFIDKQITEKRAVRDSARRLQETTAPLVLKKA